MSTFQTQIEDLVGVIGVDVDNDSSADTDAYTDWLNNSSKEVIKVMPESELWNVSVVQSDSGGGSGATVTLTEFDDSVTGASVNAAGSGYLSDPEIIITDSTGTGATVRGFSDGSALIAVDLESGGSGYSSSPVATVSGGGGVLVENSKVLYAHKNNIRAVEVPESMSAKYTDSDSIYKATDSSPVFYRIARKVFVQGGTAGGSVVTIKYPIISYGDTSIDNFPDEYEHIVVLGASVKGIIRQISDKETRLKYWTESEEDTELAQAITLEIQTLQSKLQILQAQYQQGLQMIAGNNAQ